MVNRIWKGGLLVSGGTAGEVVEIDRKIKAAKGNRVVKTQDAQKQRELRALVEQEGRKTAVDLQVTLCPGKAPICQARDEEGIEARFIPDDIIVQPAQKNVCARSLKR